MTTLLRIQRIQKLIWVLIYLGLLGVILGVVMRDAAPVAGVALIGLGLVAVVAGIVLIYVRSRMTLPPAVKPGT